MNGQVYFYIDSCVVKKIRIDVSNENGFQKVEHVLGWLALGFFCVGLNEHSVLIILLLKLMTINKTRGLTDILNCNHALLLYYPLLNKIRMNQQLNVVQDGLFEPSSKYFLGEWSTIIKMLSLNYLSNKPVFCFLICSVSEFIELETRV